MRGWFVACGPYSLTSIVCRYQSKTSKGRLIRKSKPYDIILKCYKKPQPSRKRPYIIAGSSRWHETVGHHCLPRCRAHSARAGPRSTREQGVPPKSGFNNKVGLKSLAEFPRLAICSTRACTRARLDHNNSNDHGIKWIAPLLTAPPTRVLIPLVWQSSLQP